MFLRWRRQGNCFRGVRAHGKRQLQLHKTRRPMPDSWSWISGAGSPETAPLLCLLRRRAGTLTLPHQCAAVRLSLWALQLPRLACSLARCRESTPARQDGQDVGAPPLAAQVGALLPPACGWFEP